MNNNIKRSLNTQQEFHQSNKVQSSAKQLCKNNLNSFFDGSYISQFIPDKICTTYSYMAPKSKNLVR